MAFNSAKNILVGAAPLYLSVKDSTDNSYTENMLDTGDIAFTARTSASVALAASNKVRNVGYTNNGLQITYNPTYDSVTVDQLLDTARGATGADDKSLDLGLAAGALGIAPTERQLFAVGQAPTYAKNSSGSEVSATTERVYYARRVLSVQQSQFSLARNTPTTFPVTFRLLPDANYSGAEYGKIIDRVIA